MTEKKTNWIAIVGVAIVAALGGGLVSQAIDGDESDQSEATIEPAATQSVAPPTDPVAAPAPSDGRRDDVARHQSIDPDDVPVSREEADRVAAAALRIAGGGNITDLDRSDDPGEAWEIEVIRDGLEIDIALDERLERVPNSTYDD